MTSNLNIETLISSLDISSEMALIQCIIKDNSLMYRVYTSINANDFIKDSHRWLFEILTDIIIIKNQKIDFVGLALFAQDKKIKASYLGEIMELFSTSGMLNNYIKTIKENSAKKNLLSLVYEIISEVKNQNINFLEWINKKYFRLQNINNRLIDEKIKDDFCDPKKYCTEAADFYTTKENKKEIINTGFKKFDKIIKGLKTLTILSAPTGVGKTCLGLNWFVNVGHKNNIPCLYINCEMNKEELQDRIISIVTGIESDDLKNKNLNFVMDGKSGINVLLDGLSSIVEKRTLFFTGDMGKNINDISSLIYQSYFNHKIKVIFVDYVGEIDPDEQSRKENEYLSYGRYAQTLKNVCTELNIKCVLLSQIGREGDENPKRTHVQGSWKLIQKADLFLILKKELEKEENTNNIIEKYKLRIEKNRHGISPYDINLSFNKKIHTFSEKETTFNV